MALDDVSVQASLDEHRAFHVHLIAHLEQAQVAAVQRLLDGGHGVGAVARQFHHREAHAVVRHALVNLQLIGETALERDVQVTAVFTQCDDARRFFYDS